MSDIKDTIINQSVSEIITHYMPIDNDNISAWVIAVLFYKDYHNKYSLKSFSSKEEWIYKSENNSTFIEVKKNVSDDIKHIQNILLNYLSILTEESVEYNCIKMLIEKLNSKSFINRVRKEACELFYKN